MKYLTNGTQMNTDYQDVRINYPLLSAKKEFEIPFTRYELKLLRGVYTERSECARHDEHQGLRNN